VSAMGSGGRTHGASTFARLAVSAVLLLFLAWVLDPGEVWHRLSALDVRWAVAGLAISVLQVLLLAWRWQYTAGLLGVVLPYRTALREYYLGILLNQVLPGGVAGDVSRAVRHARSGVETGPAVRAVVIERLAGQVVMTTVAIACVAGLSTFHVLGAAGPATAFAVATAGVAVWVGVRLSRRTRGTLPPTSPGSRFRADAGRALLDGRSAIAQWTSAAAAVFTYLAVYLVAARAVGVDTPFTRLAPLVAPVLMTMLFPVTVAGWGVREGAAALLWSAAGLTAEDGVAVSMAYGLLVLAAALPGVATLTVPRPRGTADPGRRGDRPRAGSGGWRGGAPSRENRSPEG